MVVVNSLDLWRKGEADSLQCGTVGEDDGGSYSPKDGLSVRLSIPSPMIVHLDVENMQNLETFSAGVGCQTDNYGSLSGLIVVVDVFPLLYLSGTCLKK